MSFKSVFLYVLLLLSALSASGQAPSDSAKVYFRHGQQQVDLSCINSRSTVDDFLNSVRDAIANNDIDYIIVKTSSPDGTFNAKSEDTSVVTPQELTHPYKNIIEQVGTVEETVEVESEEWYHLPVHRLAIKTNLLYYTALLPNLELEWRINHHWSLLVEGNVAWWKNDSKHKYYQIAIVSPELRYWFRPRTLWKGWYMGFFLGGGKYDLENGNKGYYGEGGMAGLSAGYMWPIGKHLIIEAGLGAGYMRTRYKNYVPHDGHYLYQRTKNMNYFGPLKAMVSIGWRFYDINKSKKVNQHYESK